MLQRNSLITEKSIDTASLFIFLSMHFSNYKGMISGRGQFIPGAHNVREGTLYN